MFRVLLVHENWKALEQSFPWPEYGFSDIRGVEDPHLALKLLKSERLDTVFFDTRISGMTASEFVHAAMRERPTVQLVLISDRKDFDCAREAMRYGAADYCVEPIAEEEARTVLQKLADRIIGARAVEGNSLLLDVLCNSDACRQLLDTLMGQDGGRENLHLFAICSPVLPEILREIRDCSWETLFLSKEKVIFLSRSVPDRQMLAVIEAYQSNALFLYDTSPVKVSVLQNILNQVYKELSGFGQQRTGFLQMSYLGEGVPEHFNTLVFYVDNNYFKDLSLQSLSREFGINYSYLSQVFKKITRKPFSEYLTAVRLGHACQMLSGTQKKIAVIAEQVGYNDYHYFCNIFKKHLGMTPSQYRAQKTRKQGDKSEASGEQPVAPPE